MADRMHVHSSLKGKGLCYRIRWPLVVFGEQCRMCSTYNFPSYFAEAGLYLGIADVIFQTLATYHSQFKSGATFTYRGFHVYTDELCVLSTAWNPILEYKVSPKLVSFKASESRSRAHVI